MQSAFFCAHIHSKKMNLFKLLTLFLTDTHDNWILPPLHLYLNDVTSNLHIAKLNGQFPTLNWLDS